MLAVVAIGGCTSSGEKSTAANDTSATQNSTTANTAAEANLVCEALDGTSQEKVAEMIKNFRESMNEGGHTDQSFFINRVMLDSINSMLLKEKEEQSRAGKKFTTDGIRFYFGKESIGSKEVKLLLVSTTDSIPLVGGYPGEKMHHDYYCHDQSILHAPGVSLKIEPEAKDIKEALIRTPIVEDDYRRYNTCDGVDQQWVISKAFAKVMVKSFQGNFKTTTAVWFGLGRFTNMLKEKDFQGLRVYLAVLPDQKNTLVLSTVNSDRMEYFGCEKSSFISQDKNKDKNTIFKILGDTQDNGALCPINCN